jgi:hypothetical protein
MSDLNYEILGQNDRKFVVRINQLITLYCLEVELKTETAAQGEAGARHDD